MMRATKGRLGRQRLLDESAYVAAVYGHYDMSETARKAGGLMMSAIVVDSRGQPDLSAGSTHRVLVMINQTAYLVTRYLRGLYQVEVTRHHEPSHREWVLREAVLDRAMAQLTEGTDAPHAKDAAMNALFTTHLSAIDASWLDADPLPYPVVRDEEPDLFVPLPDESHWLERQWHVQIGRRSCTIGLIADGGDHPEGQPDLVVLAVQTQPKSHVEAENQRADTRMRMHGIDPYMKQLCAASYRSLHFSIYQLYLQVCAPVCDDDQERVSGESDGQGEGAALLSATLTCADGK